MKVIIYTITKYICLKHKINAILCNVRPFEEPSIYCYECDKYLEIGEYKIRIETRKREVG